MWIEISNRNKERDGKKRTAEWMKIIPTHSNSIWNERTKSRGILNCNFDFSLWWFQFVFCHSFLFPMESDWFIRVFIFFHAPSFIKKQIERFRFFQFYVSKENKFWWKRISSEPLMNRTRIEFNSVRHSWFFFSSDYRILNYGFWVN